MTMALTQDLTLLFVLPLVTGYDLPFKFITDRYNEEEMRAIMRSNRHHRPKPPKRKRTTAKYDLPDGTSYVPFHGKFPYNNDPQWTIFPRGFGNFSTTFNPYIPNNMPSDFPVHLYETNPYLRDARFNITYVPTGTPYTTTENVMILYDDILLKKLYNHRARMFNNFDHYFPTLFKRAWKYAVGCVFFDTSEDPKNHWLYHNANLTRGESILIFYQFLKKFRASLKETLCWHFTQIPDYSEEILFTEEKSILDIRHAFYSVENFISYDSNDILEKFDLDTRPNNTEKEYAKHILHVNEKLKKVIFPFVEKRYFNFLKNFKYPSAPEDIILHRTEVGKYLNKLCYIVVREIRAEKFFHFHAPLAIRHYNSEDLETIRKYKKVAAKEPQCETCEERRVIRNKKKQRV